MNFSKMFCEFPPSLLKANLTLPGLIYPKLTYLKLSLIHLPCWEPPKQTNKNNWLV